MDLHSININGSISLDTNEGISNQVLVSQGPNLSPIWSTININPKLYLYTSKSSQVIGLGPSDLTWNTPYVDNINGITYNSPGTFTLTANRLYSLIANITPTSAPLSGTFLWVDSSNNIIGSINTAGIIHGPNDLEHVHAFAIFKPLVDTIVKIRFISLVGVTVGIISSVFIESKD